MATKKKNESIIKLWGEGVGRKLWVLRTILWNFISSLFKIMPLGCLKMIFLSIGKIFFIFKGFYGVKAIQVERNPSHIQALEVFQRFLYYWSFFVSFLGHLVVSFNKVQCWWGINGHRADILVFFPSNS